jgi:carbon-monoxide dehydrogenase small subunit
MTTTSEQVRVSISVNGAPHDATVPAHQLLVDFIRETLGLTGTKVGCESGQCGACTVLLDGTSVKSCAVLAAQADGRQVTTIEGVAPEGTLSAIQTALWEQHGVQCGFCTPGMVMSLTDLLQRHPKPDERQVREWLDGNMCRCGVYQNVVRAVLSVAGGAAQPRG